VLDDQVSTQGTPRAMACIACAVCWHAECIVRRVIVFRDHAWPAAVHPWVSTRTHEVSSMPGAHWVRVVRCDHTEPLAEFSTYKARQQRAGCSPTHTAAPRVLPHAGQMGANEPHLSATTATTSISYPKCKGDLVWSYGLLHRLQVQTMRMVDAKSGKMGSCRLLLRRARHVSGILSICAEALDSHLVHGNLHVLRGDIALWVRLNARKHLGLQATRTMPLIKRIVTWEFEQLSKYVTAPDAFRCMKMSKPNDPPS
jgi:hypothetical protein